MGSPADNLAVALAWMQAMQEHDANRMGAMAAEDVDVLEVAEGVPHKGRGHLVWAYEDLFGAYPDCSCDVLNTLAGDDQVLVEVQWRGTETGSFRGAAPSGGKVDIRIGYVFRFADGVITAITEYYDAGTLAKQLGGGERSGG